MKRGRETTIWLSETSRIWNLESDAVRAICIYFGPGDRRNLTTPCTTEFFVCDAVMEEMYQRAPKDEDLKIYTDFLPREVIFTRRDDRDVEISYRYWGNPASKETERCCFAQMHGRIPTFAKCLQWERSKMWLLCALRLGLPKDIRCIIGKMVFMQKYRGDSDVLFFK